MQTFFTPQQLADKEIKKINKILRTCVHCGICTTACPTYLETRDERNSPRGRIYLLKSLFESSTSEKMKTSQKYLDYCLNCKACETSCPSGVEYSELAKIGREYLDRQAIRNFFDSSWRKIIVFFLTTPNLIRISITLLRPIRKLLFNKRLFSMLDLIPLPGPRFKYTAVSTSSSIVKKQPEILLAHGCVGSLVRPSIHKSSLLVLKHLGYKVNSVPNNYCCGSLASHSGLSKMGTKQSKIYGEYFSSIVDSSDPKQPVHLVSTISGCTKKIEKISKLPTWEFAHFISTTNLQINKNQFQYWRKKRLVWHTPCSIRHDLKSHNQIASLWKRWNLNLIQPEHQSLCCGAAGAYMFFQSSMSKALKQNKVQSFNVENPEFIITHNIGCLEQLRYELKCPILMASEFIALLSGLISLEEIKIN